MSEKINILGIPINKVTLHEATEICKKWLNEDKQRLICTPNPEIILEAQKNPQFAEVLKQSDLNIADGTGLIWASHSQLPERVTGVDLMTEICKIAGRHNYKIFLLGAGQGIAEKVKINLQFKYPTIQIVGTSSGRPEDEDEIIKQINQNEAEILFVAFGAPKQEIWIHKNLQKMPMLKIAMGVGGAFDFISGTKKRAPKIMQKLGAEWLFRLIQEPKRIKRIYNAVVKFPIAVIKSKH